MATPTFPPPTAFDFARPEEWPRWKKRFLRYREATGLDKKDGSIQISTLVYSMGDKAEDILSTMTLTSDEKSFDTVISKIEDHLSKNGMSSMSVLALINAVSRKVRLWKISSQHCTAWQSTEFKTLQDEMIRDRIVVGLRDAKVSEKLQLDAALTLEKAITVARQNETVKQQQKSLRSQSKKNS